MMNGDIDKNILYPKNDLNVHDVKSINFKFILSTNSSTRILINFLSYSEGVIPPLLALLFIYII